MHTNTPFTLSRPHLILLLALAMSSTFNLGCASAEKSKPKEWEQTVVLQSRASVWLRADAGFAKIIIINEGPADLKVRIPAVGTPIFDEITLEPKQSYRDLFFETRSITFTNSDPRRLAIFHYQIKGDPMTVQLHKSN